MKKVFKILLSGFFFIIVVFGFYLYKLHALSAEGNTIFEYRCLHVNTHLIAYKNAFLKYADFLNTYPNTKYSPDQVKEFLDEYFSGLKAYVPEETKWLDMQKKFIDRWDFQLMEPLYMKEGSVYQWKMYEGYRDDAMTMVRLLDNPESSKNVQLGDVTEERQRRDKYMKLYFDFFEKASKIRDWRKFFSYVPVPKGCTKENIMIPNTSGSIDWQRGSQDATPSGIPIDPYGVS